MIVCTRFCKSLCPSVSQKVRLYFTIYKHFSSRKRCCWIQYLVTFCLARSGGSDQHETVTNDGGFVQLDAFVQKSIHVFHSCYMKVGQHYYSTICNATCLVEKTTRNLLRFFLHSSTKEAILYRMSILSAKR